LANQLSICATAMLAAIVSNDILDTDQLLEIVPYREPALGCDGDVGRWFDELQVLLDYALIVREPAPHAYQYRPTTAGVDQIYGWRLVRLGAA
jgi:hypothetical protein